MDVSIRGRNTDVSPALRAAATEKVARLGRFLDGIEAAEVHFVEERNPRITEREVCEVTIRARGQLVRAKACSTDGFASLERVVDKLEHQIQRLKGRRLARSHSRRHDSVDSRNQPQIDEDGDDDRSRIVKTKQFSIKPMTPEEAALQMELLGHSFYFFTNADTERAAVVYRRDDGYVGLIDAH